jgi:hypothetical protein
MSIEVRVPEEIADYKESIIAGLSIRQLVCGGIALLCGIPTFLLLRNVNTDLATYATMIVTIPAFCLGFIKKDGYNFETFLKIKLYAFFSKNQRGYETNIEKNILPVEVEQYRQAIQEMMAEEEKEIMQQGKKRGDKRVLNKREQRHKSKNKGKAKPEYDLVEITKKGAERKRKTAYKSIKAATRNNRKEKQKKPKKVKSRGGS